MAAAGEGTGVSEATLTQFEGVADAEAREFAARWLPAWTGNDPEWLASFYTDDAFYSDPALPDGVKGREALLDYFRKLLAHFPDWVWTNLEVTPLEHGFLNTWHARIPIGDTEVECIGVCTVQFRDGLIADNRVYFDRSPVLAALANASS